VDDVVGEFGFSAGDEDLGAAQAMRAVAVGEGGSRYGDAFGLEREIGAPLTLISAMLMRWAEKHTRATLAAVVLGDGAARVRT
jgi:hypothetical protein